ncbi:MAG: AsmA family protein [Legionella sp.]|nr:AsmA family protein [Legionella sp.]
MKFLRKLLVSFLAITLFLTAALWILAHTINPEVLREYVSNQLTAFTSEPSRIEGDITWKIFPTPGIKISSVQIGDEKNNSYYSLTLKSLILKLKIMPLLQGKVVFNTIKVDSFDVQINADRALPVQPEKITKRALSSDQQLNNQFAVNRLLLSHGRVTLINKDQKLVLSDLQIGATQINLQHTAFPIQLKSTINYTGADKIHASAQLQFKGHTSLHTLVNTSALDIKSSTLNGQLVIKNAEIDKFKIDKLNAHTSFKNNTVSLNPLTIHLYQGESVGDLRYDLAQKTLQINQTATRLNSATLSKDLLNKRILKGNMDISLHTHTNLQTVNWQDTTTGHGNINIKNGKLELVNLNKVIEVTSNKINTLLSGKKLAAEPNLDITSFDDPQFFKGGTPFQLMAIQYRLENALLSSDSLILETERLQLRGQGQLSLHDYALDTRFLAMVTVSEKKVNEIQQLLGGSFPLRVNGLLTEPKVLPDLKKINPILTQLWLKEKLTKPVKKIKEQFESIFPKHL